MMNIKNWSIRKGCFHCREPLDSFKEKALRTCNSCAAKSLEGFQDMSEGRFKSGFQKVIGTKSESEQNAVKSTVKAVMKTNRKKVEKRLKKKGMSQEEIKEGLDGFNKV